MNTEQSNNDEPNNLEHHEYAKLFPMLEKKELQALSEDIKKNAQQQAIVLFEGKILDGRNRYEACKLAEIEPKFDEYKGSDPLRFVLSTNLHRRHLTDKQRAAIAADIANLGNGQRKSVSQNSEAAITQAEAAALLNVNKRSVEEANKIKKEDPAAHEAAKAGKVTRKPRSANKPKAKTEPKPSAESNDEQAVKAKQSPTLSEESLEKLNNVFEESVDPWDVAHRICDLIDTMDQDHDDYIQALEFIQQHVEEKLEAFYAPDASVPDATPEAEATPEPTAAAEPAPAATKVPEKESDDQLNAEGIVKKAVSDNLPDAAVERLLKVNGYDFKGETKAAFMERVRVAREEAKEAELQEITAALEGLSSVITGKAKK